MNQLRALAWKEWHESRAYLFIGIGIFLGLPVIGAIEQTVHTTHRFEIDTTTWVLAFGGVLAVLVAVGGSCRDMNGRLEDFWRSRPVSVSRWFLVKYVVGLLTVLTSCMVPIAVELFFNRDKDPLLVLVWFPFLWAAIYSVGFVAGCITRKPAHAATLALAGMLLIYFMPVILPPLEWLNTSRITERDWPYNRGIELFHWREIAFGLGMAAVAVVGLSVALLAVYRDWRVESGRKTLYGLVASALLLLLASAAFQLGTNLPILQIITLPADERIVKIRCTGNQGFVLTYRTIRDHDSSYVISDGNGYREPYVRTIDISSAGIQVSGPKRLGMSAGEADGNSDINNLLNYASTSLSPQVSCRLNWVFPPNADAEDPKAACTLWMYVFNGLTGEPLQSIRLWDGMRENRDGFLHVWEKKLFVFGHELLVFDISDARVPRLVKDRKTDVWAGAAAYWKHQVLPKGVPGTELMLPLPMLPELPREERVKIAASGQSNIFDGSTLCTLSLDGMKSYRLVSVDEYWAVFDQTGEYKWSFLERSFGVYINDYYGRHLQNGLLYHTDASRSSWMNSAISVFDMRAPHAIRRVGHFAAPDVNEVQPLPDGRAITGGGNKVYLIGPPVNR